MRNDVRDGFYLLALLCIFGCIAYIIVGVASAAAETLAAIIGAAATIAISIFAYIFQLRANNEQNILQIEANRKQTLLLAKQDNYRDVLDNMTIWLRNPEHAQ